MFQDPPSSPLGVLYVFNLASSHFYFFCLFHVISFFTFKCPLKGFVSLVNARHSLAPEKPAQAVSRAIGRLLGSFMLRALLFVNRQSTFSREIEVGLVAMQQVPRFIADIKPPVPVIFLYDYGQHFPRFCVQIGFIYHTPSPASIHSPTSSPLCRSRYWLKACVMGCEQLASTRSDALTFLPIGSIIRI